MKFPEYTAKNIKEVFEDLKTRENGLSLAFNILLRFFVSPEKFVNQASKFWKEAGAIGDLKIGKYDLKKKYLFLRVENFHLHPLYCQIFKGYFLSSTQIIFKTKVSCEETKCTFRGDKYHEFSLKW